MDIALIEACFLYEAKVLPENSEKDSIGETSNLRHAAYEALMTKIRSLLNKLKDKTAILELRVDGFSWVFNIICDYQLSPVYAIN